MEDRLPEYLRQMREAAHRAMTFVEGFDEEMFLADHRTQQAVTMSSMIIGEAAAKILERDSEVISKQPDIPWLAMRGMRNRIAHGYFVMDMNVVWATVRETLPDLISKLDSLA